MRPVASTGLPTNMYHAAHCFSRNDRLEKSRVEYSWDGSCSSWMRFDAKVVSVDDRVVAFIMLATRQKGEGGKDNERPQNAIYLVL